MSVIKILKLSRGLHTSSILNKNYYEILGIPKNSSQKDIKKAYYEKAKKYHPDANKSDPKSASKFQEVSEAYEVLSDPSKRQTYDMSGSTNTNSNSGGFHGFQQHGQRTTWNNASSFGSFTDPEDLFRKIFEEFEKGYGGSTDRSRRSSYDDSSVWGTGTSTEITLSVTFKEAAIGCEKETEISSPDMCGVCHGSCCEPGRSPIKCPYCHGTGTETITNGPYMLRSTCRVCKGSRMYIKDPCRACQGKGQTLQRKRIVVPVPAGVTDGQTIRMKIQNNKELYVTFSVAKSAYFKRDDSDIHTDASISVSQAILGGTVRIEGLYGDVTITINPGTSSHSRIRLPQKGIKRIDSYGRGDHYVHIKIQVPERPTNKQKELIRAFANATDDESKFGTVDGSP